MLEVTDILQSLSLKNDEGKENPTLQNKEKLTPQICFDVLTFISID